MIIFGIFNVCISQEYLLKWKNYQRPTWEKKSNMNCNHLIVDFEKTLGPNIKGELKLNLIPFFRLYTHICVNVSLFLSAKRENNQIKYLIQSNNGQDVIVNSTEVKKFAASVIDFLEKKNGMDGIQRRNSRPASCFSAAKNKSFKSHLYVYTFLQLHFSVKIDKIELFLTDATNISGGLVYVFGYSNGEVAVLSSVDAIALHPQMVLNFLESCIA